MSAEHRFRQEVVKALRPLHAVSVENPAGPGTPDVNYVEGWIELKRLSTWPSKAATCVKLEHFTAQQRVWILKRLNAGGRVHVLLSVKGEWLLYSGRRACELLGKVDQSTLRSAAEAVWPRQNAGKELLQWLQNSDL